ncbi:MAG TPA: hypothetical protein VFT30_07275, partial [Nitrospira sp.]|nr:hypothetical protein [Nitrospira sp.]
MFYSVKGKIKIYLEIFVCYNGTQPEKYFPMNLEHNTITTNGIRLHVVQAGPKSGVPVVLVQGFPEFWYGYTQLTKRVGVDEEIHNFSFENYLKWIISSSK